MGDNTKKELNIKVRHKLLPSSAARVQRVFQKGSASKCLRTAALLDARGSDLNVLLTFAEKCTRIVENGRQENAPVPRNGIVRFPIVCDRMAAERGLHM